MLDFNLVLLNIDIIRLIKSINKIFLKHYTVKFANDTNLYVNMVLEH